MDGLRKLFFSFRILFFVGIAPMGGAFASDQGESANDERVYYKWRFLDRDWKNVWIQSGITAGEAGDALGFVFYPDAFRITKRLDFDGWFDGDTRKQIEIMILIPFCKEGERYYNGFNWDLGQEVRREYRTRPVPEELCTADPWAQDREDVVGIIKKDETGVVFDRFPESRSFLRKVSLRDLFMSGLLLMGAGVHVWGIFFLEEDEKKSEEKIENV